MDSFSCPPHELIQVWHDFMASPFKRTGGMLIDGILGLSRGRPVFSSARGAHSWTVMSTRQDSISHMKSFSAARAKLTPFSPDLVEFKVMIFVSGTWCVGGWERDGMISTSISGGKGRACLLMWGYSESQWPGLHYVCQLFCSYSWYS